MRNRPRTERPDILARIGYHYTPNDAFDLEDALDGFFLALEAFGIDPPVDPNDIIASDIWALDQIAAARIMRKDQKPRRIAQTPEATQACYEEKKRTTARLVANHLTIPADAFHAFLFDCAAVDGNGREIDPATGEPTEEHRPYAHFFYQYPDSFVCYTEAEYKYAEPERKALFQRIRILPTAIGYFVRSDNPYIIEELIHRDLREWHTELMTQKYLDYAAANPDDPVSPVINKIFADLNT